MAVLSAVLVIVVLVVVLLLVTGGARGGGPAARSWRDLARYASPSSAGGMVSGLVAALAASSTSSLIGIPVGGSITIGIAIGVLFAILAVVATRATPFVLGAFGLAGITGSVFALLAGAGCSTVPLAMRILALAVIGIAAGAGVLLALLRGRVHPHSVLGLFGAVRVVTFLASPLGISIVLLPVDGWIVAIVGAALFGFIAGVAPDLVIGISALAVSFASIAYGATLGTACSTGAEPGDLTVLVGFALAFVVARPLIGRLVPR
ncbi:MAG: hypothetical protein V4479_00790 [Actinomycetota bacterium]